MRDLPSLDGYFLLDSLPIHSTCLHAQTSVESLSLGPFHKHVVQLDKGFLLLRLVLYCIGVEGTYIKQAIPNLLTIYPPR